MLKIKSELGEIYLNQIIYSFSITLIGVFIPVYLLELGFSLSTVITFMLVYLGVMGIGSPPVARIAGKLGFKHTILFSTPIKILYLSLLIIIPSINPMFLFVIAMIGGLSDAFYWVPLNSEFAKNTKKIHAGDEVGHLYAFPKLATLAAPFLGGVGLKLLGFETLFVIAIFLLLISVTPLFLTSDYKARFLFKLRDVGPKRNRFFSFVYFLKGFTFIVETIIWPLFIFVTFQDIMFVGAAASISALGIAIFTLIVGRLCDRYSRKKVMKIGALAYSGVWFSRLFTTTIMEAFILSFLGGILMTVISVSVFSMFCDYARGGKVLSRVMYREVWLNVGRVGSLFLLLLVFFPFQFAFVFAGSACLVFLALK